MKQTLQIIANIAKEGRKHLYETGTKTVDARIILE